MSNTVIKVSCDGDVMEIINLALKLAKLINCEVIIEFKDFDMPINKDSLPVDILGIYQLKVLIDKLNKEIAQLKEKINYLHSLTP